MLENEVVILIEETLTHFFMFSDVKLLILLCYINECDVV